MRTKRSLSVGRWLLVALALCLVPDASAQQGTIVREKVYSPSLEGNLLGDSPNRDVTIYLPPSYDTEPDRRYPVVYLLHGYTGNHNLWTGGSYTSGANIRASADAWIEQGKMKPAIIVMPNSYNKVWGSWYANSPATGQWADYIAQDLVEYTDTHYRTLAQRQSRAISGHSMGGYGALRLGILYPGTFGVVGAMDPGALDYPTQATNARYYIGAASRSGSFAALSWDSSVWTSLLMALVPDMDNPPFHCDFPWYYDANNKLVQDGTAYNRLLEQDVLALISQHADIAGEMKGLCVVVALNNPGGLQQGDALHERLDEHGVEHRYEKVPGTHTSMLMQATEITLSEFSNVLASEIVTSVESAGRLPVTWAGIRSAP